MKGFLAYALLAAFCISGCATIDPNYSAYLKAHTDAVTAESAQAVGLSDASGCAGEARCVENVKAFAALASAKGGSSGAMPSQFVAQPSFWKQAGLALIGQAGTFVNGAVAWHQADTAASTAIAQYSYLDHVLSGAVTGMANTRPSINVGGNYGDTQTQVGDNVTGDKVGRDKIGTQVGGDQAGRDNVTNSGIIGDGRQGSPGPYTDSCQGTQCQQTPPPPATDPATPTGDLRTGPTAKPAPISLAPPDVADSGS